MNTQKPNVYIVDDDQLILELYSMMIKSNKYNVITYKSGYDFIEHYDASVSSCVLIDLNMPDIDGLSLFKKIKSLGILIPTIFISSYEYFDRIPELYREGAFDYISKPHLNSELLLSVIENALLYATVESVNLKKMLRCQELFSRLTEREIGVLSLVCDGIPAKVIAKNLNISYRTVETHISNIKHKTQLDTSKLMSNFIFKKEYSSCHKSSQI